MEPAEIYKVHPYEIVLLLRKKVLNARLGEINPLSIRRPQPNNANQKIKYEEGKTGREKMG